MKETFFGLKHVPSGKVFRLASRAEEGRSEATLTLDEFRPLFEVESLAALERALSADTPTSEATPETPFWGGFRRDELDPVRVEVEKAGAGWCWTATLCEELAPARRPLAVAGQ